jgi:hypothetical protein
MRTTGHAGSIQQGDLMPHFCGILPAYCYTYFFLRSEKITHPIIYQIENTVPKNKYLFEPKVCMM